jgi:CRISPR-associated protein Cas1
MRENILNMSYAEWKKMGNSKGRCIYLKKGAKGEKPFKLYGKVEERLEQMRFTGRHKTTRDE